MKRPEIRPWQVGEEAVCVVGVEGVIESLEDGVITIAGHTLPASLGNGVRYLSMVWPEGDQTESYCLREHVDDQHIEEDPEREALLELVDLVRAGHDAVHSGPLRFCAHRMCRLVATDLAEVA